MKKSWVFKTLILSLIISVVAGNISILASGNNDDSTTIGTSTTIGESKVIKVSSNKRISDLLAKSKPWDGQTIADTGIYSLAANMVITSDVSIAKGAILIVPQEFTLSIEGGSLDNKGEVFGMIVISGGNMIHSGKIETIAVLDGNLTNNANIDNLMLGGGTLTNNEMGKIQTGVASGGELHNFGNVKLIEIRDNATVNNQDGGILTEAKVSGGTLLNNINSVIELTSLISGTVNNYGTIDNTTQSGGEITNNSILNDITVTQGKLMNLHTIEGLTVSGGISQNNGDITDTLLTNGEFTNQTKGKISKMKVSGGILANEGSINKLKIDGATLENRLEGKLQQTELLAGNFYNIGSATEVIVSGGMMENRGALTKLQIIDGKAINQESLIKDVELTGGEFTNNGLTEIANVSRNGIINNSSTIKQVIIKNTGTLLNQGDIKQITNNMGEPMYKISIQNSSLGKGNAEADRRNVTNRYVLSGKKLKLTAVPEEGNQFAGWAFSGDPESAFKDALKAETTMVMPAEDVVLIPTFQALGSNVVGQRNISSVPDEEIPEELPGELAK